MLFRKEVDEFNKERKKETDSINKKRNSSIVSLLKKINQTLVEYSKTNELSTVIDKKYVVITKSENDITKQILEILNK